MSLVNFDGVRLVTGLVKAIKTAGKSYIGVLLTVACALYFPH